MASSRPTVGEVEISAFVKIDQRSVADGIKSIESQAKRAGSAVTKLNRPLGEITGNVTEFSKSLEASNARVLAFGASAGAIYALSRSFKFLVDSMIQVEKELKDINVILGASEKQLKGFSKELFNIAGATGQSFKTVAVAAKELSRQGLSMEQTLLRTRDALILTRLSGMDAESAVASLTAAINTFNRSMLDSTKIVNKMANVDAAFAVSTQDLAEAMKRVGSTAQDVSVDFNQLLGAVTSLQQTTARGGPVIGNGLKSIFTRIQRTDTLDQLESLGVAVRGLQGDMLPAMQVLTNLAKAFPALTKAQQAHTAETVAGVFQMNTLRALLNDLGKGYSVYEQAVRTATNSTNQAIERNQELNKTLDAQIKKLSARLIQAAKSGGDMLLGPAVQNITGVLDKVLGDAEKGSGSVGAKIGRDIAKGALEGLGKMLAGPGLIALVAVGVKIGKNLSKFLVEATLDMFNMQNASMKIAATEKVITDELSRQSVLQDQYLKGLITRRDLELQVLSAVSARSKQEAAAGAFVTRTATSAVQRGGGMGSSGKFSTGRSSGHIPNFVSSAESTMERAGAVRGGYAPGSVRKTNIAGLGSVTYNSAESVKHVPGFAQPFINPPGYSRAGKAHQKKSIKETGIDPYASYGVVPNFVRYMTPSSARMKKAGLGKADKMMTMTDLVEMVRQGPGKGGRAFSVTFRDSSGSIHTQTGQRAKYEAYGKGRASHYEEDGLGYLRWNPMDQNKRSKGKNPKAFREARLDRIMNISFDKKQYSMDPTRLGPDGLPSMVLTGVARSSGHVPNFSRFGGSKFPVPIMPFHGASVGKYEGYKSTKAFQKPGSKGGASFENYKDFNNALSRTFGGNLKDNVVYPGQIGSAARSQGLASLLGPTIGVQNILTHPAYQKFSKMATPLGFQPNKRSVTELLQSVVNQAPKNAVGYYRSKDYSNLFEELVGLGGGANLANPGFGIKGASNFMGTAGLPTVEGMMKHGGQTRFMEIKASDSADNMSRLLGKSMQLYPDKYRSLAQKYATPSDFKIIDNFLGKFSNKPKFASGMEEAAYKTGGRFVDSYMSGGHVPSFARFSSNFITGKYGRFHIDESIGGVRQLSRNEFKALSQMADGQVMKMASAEMFGSKYSKSMGGLQDKLTVRFGAGGDGMAGFMHPEKGHIQINRQVGMQAELEKISKGRVGGLPADRKGSASFTIKDSYEKVLMHEVGHAMDMLKYNKATNYNPTKAASSGLTRVLTRTGSNQGMMNAEGYLSSKLGYQGLMTDPSPAYTSFANFITKSKNPLAVRVKKHMDRYTGGGSGFGDLTMAQQKEMFAEAFATSRMGQIKGNYMKELAHPLHMQEFQAKTKPFLNMYAGGLIPNFANNALASAFSREKKASGLPGSQIYATTVDTPNYSGPVVGNKRDEPTYGSLRKAVINHPDPARAGMSRGNVPNFAAVDMIPGYGLFKGMQNFFDKELKDLEKQFKEDVKASKALSQETRSATKTTQRSQARMDVLNARINDLNGLTEQSNKLEQKGGAKASVLRDPGLLRQQMRSLDRLSSRGLIENLDKGAVKTLKTQVSALLGDTLTTAQKRSIGGTKIGTTGFKAGQLLQGKSFLQAQADLQARGKTLRGTAGFMGARDSQKAARSFLSNMGVDTKGMKGNTQILQAMKGVESSVNMASKQGQGFQRIMLGLEAQDVKNRQKALNQFATQVATGTGTAKAPGLQGALNLFSMAKGGVLFDKKGAPIIDPKTGEQRTTKLAQQQAARQATLESARLAEEEKRQRRDTASRQAGETKQSVRQQRAMGTGFGGFMARNPMVGMQAGMALSFLGPMAGGAMAQALGGPTKAQRRNAAIAQGVGSTVGYAATGGMMASMAAGTKTGAMGGPKGMAIGAGIGLAIGIAQSLFTVGNAMESISSDVRQAYEAENKAKEDAANATSQFVKSQNAYIEAMERGAGAQTLDALKQKTIESLVQIGDPNLTRKLLAAGNDPNKVADVNAEIQRKNEAQKKIFGERGAIEQMVNAGKAETISEAGLKAIASDIALFGNLGKGPVTEGSLKKAGIDTSSDLLEGFADLMDGDVVGSLIVFIEAKRKEIAAAKKASGAQTASAKALLRLKEATMAAISAKEADLRLADLFHSGAAKMREVVNGLEQNVSSFRTMDKQLKLSIENNKRSLVMDNTILMQRAGQSLLAQGTKGVTSGFGTSGQQAMGQLGGILMAGNLGPAKTMQQLEGVLNNILNDPTISQKDKSGIQQQMDKLATEMAENTAKTAIQNNLIELQTAVEKSNIDFRQRMNMQGQGLGGGGNGLGFMNAVLSLSGQQSGALNRSQELGARAQGFETLRGMGFDLNRGGLGDTFRNFKADRFKSEASNQLDFLLGDPKLTKQLVDPKTSIGQAGTLVGSLGSKQGDLAMQILRTLKSPEIDKARSDIEGSIQKEQATLQSSLVDIIGGNTQMLNQLIQSQSQLIDSNGNLAAVMKTMPTTLREQMRQIMGGYNQQQVNQAAGKAGSTMMQMNAGKSVQGAALDRFLNPQIGGQQARINMRVPLGSPQQTQFPGGVSLLQTKGFQDMFSTKGTGQADVTEIDKAGGSVSYRLNKDFKPNKRFRDAFGGAGVAMPTALSKPGMAAATSTNRGYIYSKPSDSQKSFINSFRKLMTSKTVASSKNTKQFEAAVAAEYGKQGGLETFGISADQMVKVARQVVINEGKSAHNSGANPGGPVRQGGGMFPTLSVQNPAYQQSANQITGGAGNLANILTGTGGATNPQTGMPLPASENLQTMQKHLSNMLAKQQEFTASGDTANAQVMGGHIQKLQDHMRRTATAQGLVNPQFQGGTLVHQPQAHAQGGGLVPLAAPGAALPAGATAIPATPANTTAQGLSQQAGTTAATAQAAAQRTQTLIDQLSATTQLGNFSGKRSTLNIQELINKAAENRANLRSSSELLAGQQEGAIMAQGGSVPNFRRQANRGILEKQASVLQEAIATGQKTIETEQDATKKADLLAVVKADQAALGKIETELSENYIKERAEEINQLKRKGTLIQELNGGLAMGHTAEQQLLSETQAKTQQLMQDIMTGRENGKTEQELADKKKELKELFAQTPAQEFNSALSLFIQETNKLRGELEDGSAKRRAIEQQKRSDLDLDTQLMLETGVNRNSLAMSMQKKREQLGIEKARTGIQLGTGTHGQLAQAQNAATTAALRRGDIDVGEALRRQMASKVMANKGDYKEQILNDVADLSNKMSGHFASAWESFVTGASSGKDALKGFASAVAMEMQRLLFKHTIGRVMDNVFSSAFGALGAASSAGAGARQAGGYIPKRYNSGGMVTGGSGYKDDVPAMMSGGEFVIRKSSVDKYGSGLMSALNSGSVPKMNKGGSGPIPSLAKRTIPVKDALKGEFSEVDFESAPTFAGRSGARGNFSNARSRGVSMGLSNAFLMNDPDRPGRGFSRVNRRLSNRALRSDSLVQSKFRRSRADKFMSYHEYLIGELDRRQESRQNFRDQKAGVLKAGMINAAVSGAIAGGMTYRNLNSPKIDGETGFTAENIDAAKAQGFSNQEIKMFQDSGVTLNPSGLPNMARGGLIKRFAMGGSNRDSVPALLMGGEYVMNRQATNKYGTSFMNRLNRGQVSGFQNGGYVGGTGLFDGAGQVDNALSSDKIVRLVDLTENINRLMEESSVKEAEVREGQDPDSPESSGGGIVNHINISINTAAGQTAEADVETRTEASGGDQADDQSTERSIEDNEKLADSLRSVVLDTIVKEQRPGGLLSK